MKRTDRFIRDCKSWDDFYQRNKSLPEGEKGANFERLVQLYLQTRSEYANNNLTNVWLLRDVRADVCRELNLPSQDEGIDLIARDTRGTC
jgi:predicted helicase